MNIKKIMIVLIFLFLISNIYSKDSIVFGKDPGEGSIIEVKEKYSALADYLSEKLDKKVVFVVTTDYKTLGEEISKGNIDIGQFSSAAYVLTKEKYPNIKYLSSIVEKKTGRDVYDSYIIVRKDSMIKNYIDLKDKRFGFVDENSSSGYKFPVAMMLSKWSIIPNKYFKKIFYLGTHPAVLKAVYSGYVDAGAIASPDFNLEKLNYEEDAFEIIDMVKDIPLSLFAVSGDLDKEMAANLKKILLEIDENTKTKDGRIVVEKLLYKGFIERDESFYDIIKETNKEIKKYIDIR